MTALTPTQERVRDSIESLIALAEPALDLVLGVGDRVSRIVGGGDDTEPLATPPSAESPPASIPHAR